MNAGAAIARAPLLLFLHADTRLPEGAMTQLVRAIAQGALWGRFDVKISGTASGLGLIGTMMNLRSRLSGIATGDQAIFVRRDVFKQVGGFPDLPLMEDISFSRQMKRLGRPACLSEKVITSGRRWEKHGVLRTILLMWSLRLRFFLGADPADLAREYGYAPRQP
jgi:rSAM/selenodomain-associated transferase 2